MVTLAEFIKTIYRDAPPEVRVAWGSLDTPSFPTVAELIGQVDEIEVPQTRDVYYTPGTFNQATRKKETFAGTCVLWADRDVYKEGVAEPLLPPTFRIRSGRGEHLIWMLDQFTAAIKDVEQANKNLLIHVGRKGEGTWNADRFLRLPGSNNCKYLDQEKHPEYKEPLPCLVVEFNPDYIYSLSDLYKLQPYNQDLMSTPLLENGQLDRSKRDWALAKTLIGWGVQEYAVKAAITYHSPKGEARPDYVNLTYNNAKASVAEDLGQVPKAPKSPKAEEDKALLNAGIEPVAHLIGPSGREEGIVVHVFWAGGSITAPATASEFNGGKSIIGWLDRNGAPTRTFFGSDAQAKHLYASMVEQCPKEQMLQVQNAGRYDLDDGTRLFIYDRNKALIYPPERKLSVIWRPQISRDIRLQLDSTPLDPEQAVALLTTVQACQVPAVMQVALGWAMACPFKPLIEESGARMPAMLLYGFFGSGKSSLIEFVLLPLLGLFSRAQASSSSQFSLLATLVQFNAVPGWWGEWRPSNLNALEVMKLLREAYDIEFETRGTQALTVNDYKLVAPVILDGESPFDDPANTERTLELLLSKPDVLPGTPQWQAFQNVLGIPMAHFKRFAWAYYNWSLTLGVNDIRARLEAARLLFIDTIEAPRMVNSLAIAWTGLSLLKEFCGAMGWDVSIMQDKDAFLRALGFSYTPGLGIKTLADTLCEQISHYTRTAEMGIEYEPGRGVIWFNLTRASTAMRLSATSSMLRIQLEQRRTVYIVGPERREGGAEYYGIDVKKAHAVGLDIYAPFLTQGPATMPVFTFDEEGNGVG